MRDHDGVLTFDPRLPKSWPELRYRMIWHGTRVLVTLKAASMHVTVLEGQNPISFLVRGESYTVSPGVDALIPLDGQGTVRPGKPRQIPSGGTRRDDGTLMVPQVPTVTDTITVIAEIPTITDTIPTITTEAHRGAVHS